MEWHAIDVVSKYTFWIIKIIGCQVWLDDPTPCLIIKAGNSENYIW